MVCRLSHYTKERVGGAPASARPVLDKGIVTANYKAVTFHENESRSSLVSIGRGVGRLTRNTADKSSFPGYNGRGSPAVVVPIRRKDRRHAGPAAMKYLTDNDEIRSRRDESLTRRRLHEVRTAVVSRVPSDRASVRHGSLAIVNNADAEMKQTAGGPPQPRV
ncbi:hypothetical protein EVAR_8911_1 [Eumeta japonica]|uniref:Uncharacterized protein n=1 Tax=Eumeta variegata TaxID=151549 RepID=A0A4C1U076_EUMVA|nr:hypothetical protein EVAR_8911_1 [Eumeta japonica]